MTDGQRMKLTMDSDDHKRLSAEDQQRLNVWLSAILGMPLVDAFVWSVTLGEGFVDVERYTLDEDGRPAWPPEGDDGFEMYVQRLPCDRLPPVWT